MNSSFFHDSTFVKDKSKYYTYGTLNEKKFSEYKEFFGNITAVVKVEEKNASNEQVIQKKNLVGDIKVVEVKLNYKNVIRVVKEQMKKCDFAIIRMPSVIGTVACKEARKQKVPYMIEMVGCPRDALWNHGGIKYKAALPFLVLISKYELKRSKYTIYVTEKFLQKRYPTRGKSIGCSDVELTEDINNDMLEKRIEKIERKKETDNYKIGLIGSLKVKYKGHETAIRAISKILDKEKVELHFLGSGSKERWVELANKYEVQDEVYFDGILPHDKVYEWLDNIDIYIIPSLQEGMPRALIEAMSRGCPCIGTNTGGIPEILSENMIIKKKDYKALKEKINQLIINKKLLKEQAMINIKKSKEFEKSVLENKKKEFYKDMLKELRRNE